MINFPELEEKILKFWEENDIFAKTIEQGRKNNLPRFVFWEGPPTANGKPGLHHVLARAFKDLIPRYKTMRGFLVERKAGWDTQGLPVELQVEKALGFKGKPDIEKYGVAEFNAKCKEDVWKYKADWEKLTKRIGFWVDLEKPYITYENYYIESLWWILKKVWEAELLYKDYKVLPHCPRCGTALSSHEVAQGYKSVTDVAVTVKFKVQSPKFKDTFILSWTTTPWTLPGNVALAVGADVTYLKVKLSNEYFILAKDRLGILSDQEFKIEEEIKGQDLVGLEYEPLFDIKPLQNDKSHRVYAADFVTTTDGTGVVHTAVMYGEDDFNLGTTVGLPKYHTVDEAGKFTQDVPQWAGKFVKNKEVEQGIIDDLKTRGLLLKDELYTHDYPFCWRCSTPLLYYAKPSWFIKMSALREDLKLANEKINWYPEHIRNGRFGEWLENVKDWAISRERYWGTPLPLWVCQMCNKVACVGSLIELAELVKNPKSDPPADEAGIRNPKFDLHRPFIDEIVLPCSCGGEMCRTPEVADCWFDSGSMPLAQWGYPHLATSSSELATSFPADYIAEAIDQTRGWFYVLLAVSTLLKKSGVIKEIDQDKITPPYKNVICLGHINDKQGQKMSKSKGNIVDPWEVINKYGVDALRFHLYTNNQPGEPKNFDIKSVDEVVKKTFLILMNVVTFYELYNFQGVGNRVKGVGQNVMDRWILALLQDVANKVSAHLDKYEITEAGRLLADFVTDLSTWYVRRSRDRFKAGGEELSQAVQTLGYVLGELSKLLAPFAPFTAEEIYKKIGGKEESVHLANWPEVKDLSAEQNQFLSEMAKLKQVVEIALAKRAEAQIKIRQPLRSLKVSGLDLSPELKQVLADEVNVMEVKLSEGEFDVELDTELDDELKALGTLRDFTREVNALRKKLGFTIKDSAELAVFSPIEFQELLQKYNDEILKSTLTNKIKLTDVVQDHEFEIGDIKISIGLIK